MLDTVAKVLFENFIMFSAYYAMIKINRTEIFRWPCLNDFQFIFVFTLLVVGVILSPWLPIKWLGFIVFSLLFLFVWCDAFLYTQYSLEVNVSSLVFFIKNPRALFEETGDIDWELSRNVTFYLLPFLFCANLYISVFDINVNFIKILYAALFTICVMFSLSKSKITWQSLPLWLVGSTLMLALYYYVIIPEWVLHGGTISIICVVGIVMLLVFFSMTKRRKQHIFFHARSFMKQIFFESKLKKHKKIAITAQDEKLVSVKKYSQKKSPQYGLLASSAKHVVVIAAESFSSIYEPQLNLPFKNKLAESAVISNRHYAPSPNTARFIENFYYADYPSNFSHSLLSTLQENGFESIFLSADNTERYSFDRLLEEVGFNQIIDSRYLSEKTDAQLDYQMLAGIPRIVECANKNPLFLHIHNIATHIPYPVVDKKRFNRHNQFSRFGRYLNALEEYDYILSLFFAELGKSINLDETLIVYLGDHGEAFGELGYKCHSNATINQEVVVPFLMQHPLLPQSAIEVSSHFSVMPTILDLLGIEYTSLHAGRSSLQDAKQTPEFLYSETIVGNAPANFSIIKGKEKIMLDRTTHVNYSFDLDDNISKCLQTNELKYYQTLGYLMAKERGLLK